MHTLLETMKPFMLVLYGVAFIIIIVSVIYVIRNQQYKKLTREILHFLGLKRWLFLDDDEYVRLKSARSVDKYDYIQFFRENRDKLDEAADVMQDKHKYADIMRRFLKENEFTNRPMYSKVERDMKANIERCDAYYVYVKYVSPAGRSMRDKMIKISRQMINNLKANPAPIMTKSEYNQLVKSQSKELLEGKQHFFYGKVNEVIDYANDYRDKLIIKGDKNELDRLIADLFDRTINSIKKIKDPNSEEWDVIGNYVSNCASEVKKVVGKTKQILAYYESPEFEKIKGACRSLMDSQREFNEYINEKAQAISTLFGTRIVRNETVVDDEYNYIRPYKKSITPFTAEVSSNVFASAENNPLEYVVKNFYPSKERYPEQIQKLQTLVEELETLKEARQIIDNYKKDYQQYITDVPSFVMENDEDGFYSRLGFANISESALTVEYMFSYTSNGGFAKRTFTVPMTEETIVDLINMLQSKLTVSAFTKEQRALMTSKLRQHIKERDDYTCKICGNSTHKEPNLLLEIDHIVPISKGGTTVEKNLQTLCWKCNRSKSDKVI